MGLFDNLKKPTLGHSQTPNAPVSADDFLHITGWGDFSSDVGFIANVDNAIVKTKLVITTYGRLGHGGNNAPAGS